MDKRLKELRRQLHLNQTEFGNRIGVKQSAITGYETGIRKPLNAVIHSICKEFNVNETWLRTGEGCMFIDFPEKEHISADTTSISEENLNTFGDRILTFLDHSHLSKSDFASKLKVSNAYVSRILHNGNIPSDRLIDDICEKFSINEQWLRTGDGLMFQPQSFEKEYLNLANTILKNKDTRAMNLIIRYQKLNFVQKEALWNILDALTEKE